MTVVRSKATMGRFLRGHRRLRRPLLVASAILLAVALDAGSGRPAQAACQIPVAPDYLEQIVRNPRVVLQNSPQGGDQLIYRAQMLAAASIASLRGLISVVPLANVAQKAAIGQGMGRAAGSCSARYGDTTRRITDAVRSMGDREVTRAFAKFLTPDSGAVPLSPGVGAGTPDSDRQRLKLDGRIAPIGPLRDPFGKL
jgi:hypothetical protein